MANKKRWSEIRDINRNEALTWSSDRLREELREQKRRYEGFNKWFNSPASEYAKGGKWGYYNQSIRGQKIWDDIQYLESLPNFPKESRREGYVGGSGPTSNQTSKLNGPKTPIKNWLLRYKCTRCGYEWDSVDSLEKLESRCLLGCSNGDNHPSLPWSLVPS